MSASYTKLKSGDWGIRATEPITEGSTVAVRKKDGTVDRKVVGSIVWSGDGVTLATIASTNTRSNSYGFRRSDRAPHGRTCPMCGARDCPRAWDSRDLCQED